MYLDENNELPISTKLRDLLLEKCEEQNLSEEETTMLVMSFDIITEGVHHVIDTEKHLRGILEQLKISNQLHERALNAQGI